MNAWLSMWSNKYYTISGIYYVYLWVNRDLKLLPQSFQGYQVYDKIMLRAIKWFYLKKIIFKNRQKWKNAFDELSTDWYRGYAIRFESLAQFTWRIITDRISRETVCRWFFIEIKKPTENEFWKVCTRYLDILGFLC